MTTSWLPSLALDSYGQTDNNSFNVCVTNCLDERQESKMKIEIQQFYKH